MGDRLLKAGTQEARRSQAETERARPFQAEMEETQRLLAENKEARLFSVVREGGSVAPGWDGGSSTPSGLDEGISMVPG